MLNNLRRHFDAFPQQRPSLSLQGKSINALFPIKCYNLSVSVAKFILKFSCTARYFKSSIITLKKVNPLLSILNVNKNNEQFLDTGVQSTRLIEYLLR